MSGLDLSPEHTLDRLKAEARKRARQIRAHAAHPGGAEGLARAFPEALLGPGIVAGYWPLGAEIDALPLMDRLSASGAQLALPRMDARDAAPSFRLWTRGDALAPDAYGLLAPEECAPIAGAPRLVLTPLLAFDRSGRRLGQGGGHYDRLLARLKPLGAIACGLAYAAQELAEVPAGPLDQRMDWIVTEAEAIRI